MFKKKNILKQKYIQIYGFKYKYLFNDIDISFSKIKIFSKEPLNKLHSNYNSFLEKYSFNTEISSCRSNVAILDGDSTKAIIAGYPLDSQNVLISLNIPRYWIYIFVGLIRRLILGQISLDKIITLNVKNKKTFWLLLTNLNKKSCNDFYFSEKIGIQGFLNFLRNKKTDGDSYRRRFFKRNFKFYKN